MKPRTPLAVVACAFVFFAVNGAGAQSLSKKNSASQMIGNATVEVYGGYLSGESRELVLDAGTGHVDSRLIWTINKAAVVGGAITIHPEPWMSVKLSGWMPISSVNTMDDFDYLQPAINDWTDQSHHDDTKLNHASLIDFRVGLRVLNLPATQYFERASLEVLGGHRRFNVSWSASGGSYVYSSGGGFRNDAGNFADGQQVINYEQWMHTPFLGLGGTLGLGRWSVDGSVIGSLWGWASDRDDHVLRTTEFNDYFNNVKMVGTDVTLNYALNDRMAIFGRFEYQQYFEAHGSGFSRDYSTNTVTSAPGDSAGFSSNTMVLSVGFKGRLN